MSEEILVGLASIIILGILAQWLAWKLHLPAILLLLLFGFAAGPWTGVLHPDEVFGDLLFPLVSISVAIILFEGGLSLKIAELRKVGHVVRSLTTIGILITWVLAALGAHLIAHIELVPAILLGAILVVTGPTVIIPLLRQVRPKGDAGSIIKWEGIVNDPIGALLAVLVFEVILAGRAGAGTWAVVSGAIKALVSAGIFGLAGAVAIVILLRRFLIPDFLQNSVALMMVVTAYVAANTLQPEAGLMAVTIMGNAMANQLYASIKHIYEFKESLQVILISSLFIILAARIPVQQVMLSEYAGWLFVIYLIILVRPAMVFLSTIGFRLDLRERIFLAWMAPRGIVAAAVVSVFAIRLAERGFLHSDLLVSVTFQVIIGTVAIYGLTAPYLARLLNVASADPQGAIIAGAHPWAQDLAEILGKEGFRVILVDTNWENIAQARQRGLSAHFANVLSENLWNDISIEGIGKLLAITSNDEVNSLAALHFADLFGKSSVFQLPPHPGSQSELRGKMPRHLRGRYLFGAEAYHDYLTERFQAGAVIKRNAITEEFRLEEIKARYRPSALPLFIIREGGRLQVCTSDEKPILKPGNILISLIDAGQKAD